MMNKILPTILNADYLNLDHDISIMLSNGIEYVHIDVMDGSFVPNITFGHKIISDIKKHHNIKCDAHLMVMNPDKQIDNFIAAGTDMITIHVEATNKTTDIINKITSAGRKVGLAINPDTHVEILKKYIDRVDMFLIMSVFPGFGGQKFMPDVLEKIDALRKWRRELNLNYEIEVDGGIKLDNVKDVVKHGANMIVVGTGLYDNGEISVEKITEFRKIVGA